MPRERTVHRTPVRNMEVAELAGDPCADGPSPLLQQASEFGKVAREALEDCQRGADAEQELARRRNRSGE